jgi:hypothetical protein
MKMVVKILFAAGFLIAMITLRVMAEYCAWSTSLDDRIAKRFQPSRAGFGRGNINVTRPATKRPFSL